MGLLAAATVIAAIWIKVRVEAGWCLARAQELEARDPPQLDLAITVYRQTIRWYSPGSGPVDRAVVRLSELGETLEAAGQPQLALRCWRALRSALYGVRSLYQPYPDRIDTANGHIARLMAREELGGGPSTPDPASLAAEQKRLEAHHRELLERDHAPQPGLSLLAVSAFLLWCWGLFMLAIRGFDDVTGALLRRPAARWATLVCAAAVVWMGALAHA